MKREEIKVGMKVRVRRNDYHGVKFGALCTVLRNPGTGMFDDEVLVVGPVQWGRSGPIHQDEQYIEQADVLPARQANRSNAQ